MILNFYAYVDLQVPPRAVVVESIDYYMNMLTLSRYAQVIRVSADKDRLRVDNNEFLFSQLKLLACKTYSYSQLLTLQ
jgi:hypothetical protein